MESKFFYFFLVFFFSSSFGFCIQNSKENLSIHIKRVDLVSPSESQESKDSKLFCFSKDWKNIIKDYDDLILKLSPAKETKKLDDFSYECFSYEKVKSLNLEDDFNLLITILSENAPKGAFLNLNELSNRDELEDDSMIEVSQNVLGVSENYSDEDKQEDKQNLFNENQRTNGQIILRGALISLSGQIVTKIAYLILPTSFTNWSANIQDSHLFQNFGKNFIKAFTMPPVFDHDAWYINYVSHPYAGSFYYNSVRSQGFTPLQSFLFAAAQSTAWEYLIESVSERPSIQDLIVTPVVGSALGELTHRATLKMKQNGFNTWEKIAVTIINPTYVINHGYK